MLDLSFRSYNSKTNNTGSNSKSHYYRGTELQFYTGLFFEKFKKILMKTHDYTFQVMLELPIVLYNLRTGTVFIQSDIFCKFWSCLDYSCNVAILMLMAFGSVERHFLVFYRPVLNAHLVILHYIPLALCIIYPTVLYTYLVFFYPCVNAFDFSLLTCGGPCYYYEAALSIFDQFANIVLPINVATIANIALIARVLHQKRRMKQQRMWKKNRRLIAELLSFVILHNIVWLPMLITSLMMFYSSSRSIILVQLNINILPYGIYVVILLCPFLLAMGLVDVWPRKVSDWIHTKLWNNTVRTEPVH